MPDGNDGFYIFIDEPWGGFMPADPDATYYDWEGQPIDLGDEDRDDLEYNSRGDRVPKVSFPEKIVEALLATPRSALVTALLVLAVLFFMKVR